MTKQEAYEKIRAHFTRPGAKLDAIREDEVYGTMCVYRGDKDPKSEVRCAFGVLIPDELYTPDMEARGVYTLLKERPLLSKALGLEVGVASPIPDNVNFVELVQQTHDYYARKHKDNKEAGIRRFVEDLDRLASNANLKLPTQTGPGALPAGF